MILVTLGTNDKSFNRLLERIDKEIDNGNIKEPVLVQAGFTKYISNNMKIFDFITTEELQELMKTANLIITHGGVASILEGIKLNKKIIISPRLEKYKEHVNDHQLQISKSFSESGYVIELKEEDKLSDILKKVKKFKPKEYKSNTKNMIKLIENYIDNI